MLTSEILQDAINREEELATEVTKYQKLHSDQVGKRLALFNLYLGKEVTSPAGEKGILISVILLRNMYVLVSAVGPEGKFQFDTPAATFLEVINAD